MKMQYVKIALAMGLAVAATQTAWTEPLQRSQIATDAVWFLHLDLDKLKTTHLGQFLMEQLDQPDAQDKLAVFQAMFNFDPRKKLKGCTLYSRGSKPEDAVLLLKGDFDLERLKTLAKAGKEYESSQHGSYTIHSWIDPLRQARNGGSGRSFGSIHTNGAVVLGQSAERVGQALDLLDRPPSKEESSKLLPELGPAPDTSVLVGAARQTDLGQFAPNVEILKHFKTMKLRADEAQTNLVVEVSIGTENEDAARNLQAMTQGLLAWVAFQGDKAANNKLLQGLAITQKDTMVSATLKVSATDAVQMLKGVGAARGPRDR
jgi:hypothetical protein